MLNRKTLACGSAIGIATMLSGCAGLRFNAAPQSDSFTYYEPAPFAVVKTAADCTKTVDIIAVPAKKRSVRPESGIGSSKLSLKMTNGVITEIGQETDTKIPEILGAIGDLAKTVGVAALSEGGGRDAPQCTPAMKLYAVIDDGGQIDFKEVVLNP